MRGLSVLLFAALLLPCTVVKADAGAVDGPGLAMTSEGPVQGVLDATAGVWRFRGIPFAAAPLGKRRFARPEPAPLREALFVADEDAPVCPQIFSRLSGGCGAPADPDAVVGSEDCLGLNVWTPGPVWPPSTEPLPVMVFIHGGALVTGCASSTTNDGTLLASAGDAIVVNVQYRLGALGFLALEELEEEDPKRSAGNWGLLDQIAALHWIQENIAAFGGDPANVTVFGESAGAVSACALLASPLADDLFQRAILESGNCTLSSPLRTSPGTSVDGSTAVDRGADIATALGCDDGVDRLSCLREVPFETVVRDGAPGGNLTAIGSGFSPTIDHHVLFERPSIALTRRGSGGRDVMVGSNADEMTIFTIDADQMAAIEADPVAELRGAFGDGLADALVDVFPPPIDPAANLAWYRRLVGDVAFNCPTGNVGDAVARNGDRAFVYAFTQRPDSGVPFIRDLGSFHAFELFYVFGTFPTLRPLAFRFDLGDAFLSRAMQISWRSFAAAGEPATAFPWPTYGSGSTAHFEWNENLTAEQRVRVEPLRDGRCALLDELFSSLDADGDVVGDTDDNCPAEPNADQFDADGDGIGDMCDSCPFVPDPEQDGAACLCGDVNDDGRVDLRDSRRILWRRWRALPAPQKCDVYGSKRCDFIDALVIALEERGRGPGIRQQCDAARLAPGDPVPPSWKGSL